MFELEDFDLEDELFLNTQMTITESPVKLSNTSHVSLSVEDNNKKCLNVPNVLESSHLKNIELQSKTLVNHSSKTCNLDDIVTFNSSVTEKKLEITKPVNTCQSNGIKLNFDECFDSDDDAFFTTPDVFDKSINVSITNSCSSVTNSNKDLDENVSNSIINYQTSMLPCSKNKNVYKSNYNSKQNSVVTSIKTTILKNSIRKFPGPAGLLIENENLYSEDPSTIEALDMSLNITENETKEESLCTQADDSSFSSSPYQQFLSDFCTTDVDILLDKYNVAWIKQKLLPYTASGRFFTDKLPFFVSIIKEIDCLSPDPTVLLADKTGHIRGTIHRAVWNQFSSQLKLGAVLVLSKVGVSCQKIVKSFTLNITCDHLMAIYSISSENTYEVVVTRTTDLTNEEIVNDAKRWNLFNLDLSSKNPRSEIKSRIVALNNLKLHNTISSDQNSQLLDTSYQSTNNSLAQSTPIKGFFKPKTPIAHNLFQNSPNNLSEEPPTKRLRNEELDLKAKDSTLINEMSIVQNIFEGIDEDEMFNDFYC